MMHVGPRRCFITHSAYIVFVGDMTKYDNEQITVELVQVHFMLSMAITTDMMM